MIEFRPYDPRDAVGVRWQDAEHAGPRRLEEYMALAVEAGTHAETMLVDGRVSAVSAFLPFRADWWHAASGMAVGAPRMAWRPLMQRQRDLIELAITAHGVRMVETHVVATFAQGHHLAMALGFRFFGVDWQGQKLMARYVTGGSLGLPDLARALDDYLVATHAVLVATYAPAAFRHQWRHAREVRHG